jgi:hypothetical protein
LSATENGDAFESMAAPLCQRRSPDQFPWIRFAFVPDALMMAPWPALPEIRLVAPSVSTGGIRLRSAEDRDARVNKNSADQQAIANG